MINWKLRFKNKTTLTALIAAVVGFIYTLLTIFGVTPQVEQDSIMQLASIVIMLLCSLGIVTDPTTVGVTDSKQALGYAEPKNDASEADNGDAR